MTTPREPASTRSTTTSARKAIAAAADASNARALVPRGEVLGKSILRRRILHEDDYVEALERIIARDFFPDVALARELAEFERAQQLEAEGTPWRDEDRTVASAYGASARDVSATPFQRDVGDTPLRSTVTAGPSRSRRREVPFTKQITDEAKSLDDFLTKYTSEDNASFASILQTENDQRRQKNDWAFETSRKAIADARSADERRERLVDTITRAVASSTSGSVMMIEGTESGHPGDRLILEDGRTGVLGDRETMANAKRRMIAAPPQYDADGNRLIEGPGGRLMIEDVKPPEPDLKLVPDTGEAAARALLKGKGRAIDEPAPEPTTEQKQELARAQLRENGAIVDAWPHTARNNLFFAADANSDPTKPARQLGPEASLSASDALAQGDPAKILHRNTRLPESIDPLAIRGDSIPPSPSHSNIAAAISGTPYPGRDSGTPRVAGYGFVDALPNPSADSLGRAGLAKLMTIGALASTPRALPAQEGPFKIPVTPRREQLAHQMARDASKSLRSRHGGAGGVALPTLAGAMAKRTPYSSSRVTPVGWSPKTPRTDERSLTPAAKSLLGRTGVKPKPTPALQPPTAAAPGDDQARKRARDLERQAQERLKRARWDESPAPEVARA